MKHILVSRGHDCKRFSRAEGKIHRTKSDSPEIVSRQQLVRRASVASR